MTRTANSFFVISCTHAHLNLVFGKTKGFGEGGKGYHVSCFPFETKTSVTILDPGDPVTPLPYSSPTPPPENYREGVVEPPTVQHTVLFFSKRDNIVVILCVPRTTRHAREGTVVPGDPVLCTRGQFTCAVSSHWFSAKGGYEPDMSRML